MLKWFIIYLEILLISILLIGRTDISNYFKIRNANFDLNQGNYSGALDIYNKINEKGLDNHNKSALNLNKGVAYLNKGMSEIKSKNLSGGINSIEKGEKFLGKISTNESTINFYKSLLLGESYDSAGIGYYEKGDINKTIENRKKSIENFKSAENFDTGEFGVGYSKKMADEVQKKLDELLKKLEKENKKQQQINEQSGSGQQNDGNEKGTSGSGQQSQGQKEKQGEISGKKWTNSGQFNGIGNNNKKDEDKSTSQEELDELNKYSDSLKQFQKNNLQYLQRGVQENNNSIYDRMMNQFSQDPFFRDTLPDNEYKKDW